MWKLRPVVLLLGCTLLTSRVALAQARLGLHVVDSNGQNVGYVLDTTDAVIFIDGEAFAIAATRAGLRATNFLEFSSAGDCSNPLMYAYDNADSNGLIPRAFFTSDGVLHYPDLASGQPVPILSTRTVVGDGSFGPCNASSGTIYVANSLSAPAPTLAPPLAVKDTLDVSPAPPVATFNDVPVSHPFFKFVEALKASGITAGCSVSPPLYCPDSPLTRGQMAVFLAIALGL